jgi:hypothetical protein
MNIAGIQVFPFLYQKLTGNCVICGRRMIDGVGYFSVYKKLASPNRLKNRQMHRAVETKRVRTKYRFFCKEECIILYSLRLGV